MKKMLKVNDVGKNATYADRADGFSDRAATSATATVQLRHIRGPCGIPGSEAADNASLKAITDKEASRKSTTPRQLISFGAFKHFINNTHYKIALHNMLERWRYIIGKPITTTSLIFPDETNFCWLNSEVDTAKNLLPITTSSTRQLIHYAADVD